MTSQQPAQTPAQSVSQPANPLDQLKDIHLPESINHFQLAIGWWVLITLFLSLLGYFIYRWINKNRALKILKIANQELGTISAMPPNSETVVVLSALLKRVCLLYYPAHQVASLSGEQWLQFINNEVQQEIFCVQQRQVFSQLQYQPKQQIEAELWDKILHSFQIAIDKVIRKAVKQKKRPLKERQINA